MIKKPITIHLSTGLEARPVAQLVQVASQFNSEIYVEVGKKKVNAKSIMGMMTLGLDASATVCSMSGIDTDHFIFLVGSSRAVQGRSSAVDL